MTLRIKRNNDCIVALLPMGLSKFAAIWESINPNLAVSRLQDILRYDIRPLSDMIPCRFTMEDALEFVKDWQPFIRL